MQALANFADGFINLFRAGGNTFMGLVTGIIPMLVVLIHSGQRDHQNCR